MGIISWIVLGLVAGLIAEWLLPGKIKGGILITILLGIAGAFLGGFIGTHLHIGDVSSLDDPRSWLLAVGGAVLLLYAYSFLKKKGKL